MSDIPKPIRFGAPPIIVPPPAPLPSTDPTPEDAELFTRIEDAIRLASQLGSDAFDFIEGRGLKVMREKIRDELSRLRVECDGLRSERDTHVREGLELVQRMESLCAEHAALVQDRDRLRENLLKVAKLAAPTPQFDGPFGAWEAEKIRDEVLRARTAHQGDGT